MTDNMRSTTTASTTRRPRWRTTLILAATLGALAGAAGWLTARPLYVATGAIQFILERPVIFRELPPHRISNVDRFIEAEYRALRGPRVLDRAAGLSPRHVQILLNLPDAEVPRRGFSELPFATDPAAREATLDDRLTVASTTGSPFIEIRYAAPDAEEAYLVVQSLLGAYQDTRVVVLDEQFDRSLETLRRHAAGIEVRVADARQEVTRTLSSAPILGDPDGATLVIREQWRELEARLREIERELESRGCAAAAEPDEDAECRTLRSRARDGEQRLDDLQAQMVQIASLRASLDALRHDIERDVARHDEIRERMQDLELEFDHGSWATVLPAQRPVRPSIDQRPWRAGIGAGAVMLLALLWHGVRWLVSRRHRTG